MYILTLVLALAAFIASIIFAARRELGWATYLVLVAIFLHQFIPSLKAIG